MPGHRLHTVRECTHGGRHRHGTAVAYSADGCRCDACYSAVSLRDAQRRRLKAFGRWEPFVDAEPARRHVRALMAAGMGREQIARVSGVPDPTIGALLYGRGVRPPSVTMRVENAAALLGTSLHLAAGVGVDATGVRRRLEALSRVGWSTSRLAARAGLSQQRMSQLLAAGRVTPSTAALVGRLFEELWDEAPPMATRAERQSVSRTIRWATARGFAPPMAWDDDTIDDPAARPAGLSRAVGGPDDLTVQLLVDGVIPSGKARLAERRAAVKILASRGWDDGRIAARIGMTRDAVGVMRKRAGIPAGQPRALRTAS